MVTLKMVILKDEYLRIVEKLDALVEQGQLSVYYRKVILEMSMKVVEHLAARYETVKEGVKSVMGGKVLEYEAKTIYREGKLEGRIDATLESIRSLMETLALTAEKAMEALKIPEAEQDKYRAML